MRPVKINLTPSSDRDSNLKLDSVTTGPSAELPPSLAGPNGPQLSSTCASVDSDSDYQGRTGSSFGNEGALTPSSIAHSRPQSRSSALSTFSTTACKDGVEGNRVHRFQDPQSYSKWISSTLPDSLSGSASTGKSIEEDGLMLADDERESEPFEDESVMQITREVESKAGLGNSPTPYSSGTSGHNNSNDNNQSNNPEGNGTHQQQLLYHQQQQALESPNNYVPTPPNNPTAPPVTLTEKIRLLRTGSVSRKAQAKDISEATYSRSPPI